MPKPRPSFYLGTEIDGVHMSAEQLNVRSQNLNSLIGSISFTESLFQILLGKAPTPEERDLFDIVLVAFHGGFGLLPPTTFVPRIVAGTGVNTAQAMAAGFLASGPYHVGAIEHAMAFYAEVAQQFQEQAAGDATSKTLEQFAYEKTKQLMASGGVVGGFGHPLLRKDPRPIHMRRLVCDRNVSGVYLDIYDGATRCMQESKGIPPNVDGICGALLLHLGFQPQHGTGLFLLARSAAMLAHVVEEQTDMPYQTMKRFMLTPIVAPKIFNSNFKVHAKRFNKIRDSKVLKTLKAVFSWRSRKEKKLNSEKEKADQAAIDRYRHERDTAPIQSDLEKLQPISQQDEFAVSHAQLVGEIQQPDLGQLEEASPDVADSETEDYGLPPDEGCSAGEMLSGASYLLSACLEEDSADLSEDERTQVKQALDMLRQIQSNN